MSPFEHGEVFVLDDGGEVSFFIWPLYKILLEAAFCQMVTCTCLQDAAHHVGIGQHICTSFTSMCTIM